MAHAPVLFAHSSSLEHETGAHPERAERILAIHAELERRGGLGWTSRVSPAATRRQLCAVHDAGYVSFIEEACLRGGGYLDADTAVSAESFTAAAHGSGGAVAVVDALLSEGVPSAFSIHRPPGHHATADRAMGFCLFNHVAVAAQHALDAHRLERVMIIDWDVHHGNGTNDILHSSPQVLFLSIHQSPLYPLSGPVTDIGSGAGSGYTVNLPVPPGSGNSTFRALIDRLAVPLMEAFRPQLVLISAGFDAHADDPLAGCEMTEAGFAALARAVMRGAARVGAPVGGVLEGGYELGALARSTAATLAVLGGAAEAVIDEESAHQPGSAADALADAGVRRLARWWPSLAPA